MNEPSEATDCSQVRGISSHRLKPNAGNPREVAFMDQWEYENENDRDMLSALMTEPCDETDPDRITGLLGNALGQHVKRPLGATTMRDRIVAATVVQWLGSNVGHSFLEMALNRCGYRIVKK